MDEIYTNYESIVMLQKKATEVQIVSDFTVLFYFVSTLRNPINHSP